MHRRYLMITKYFGLAILFIGLFLVTGCPKPEDPLVGEWAAVNDNLSNYSKATIFKFNDDSTLTVFENNSVGSTIAYQIDTTRNPFWIEWKGASGIMRFLNNNTLEMGLNTDRNVPTNNFGQRQIEPATRPVNFENSSMHFILRRLTNPNHIY